MADLNITIPPEALEAAARAVHDIDRRIAGEDQWPAWEDISPVDKQRRLHRAHAACLAMLNNWLGMREEGVGVGDGVTTYEWLILPLPLTEPSDAKV
jgi:hypothetical protein